MKKLNLTPEEIYNKQFQVDFKGYSLVEVDTYLDLILQDYQLMEENVQELLDLVAKLQDQVKELQKKNVELEGKTRVIDLSKTTQYSSVDILKRISRLEEQINNK